jgi:hypothetical protein
MGNVYQLRINTAKVDKMYESAAYRQNQRAKKVCMSCVYTHRISGKMSVSALYEHKRDEERLSAEYRHTRTGKNV